MKFDISLHPSTRQRLEALLENPSHAYVFTGPRYLYKQHAAYAIALKLAGATSASHPNAMNITLVEPEEKAKSIKISQVKAIIDQLYRLSFDTTHYRVVIVRDAHKMTNDASNALLKVLEEPGDRIVFILVTDRAQNLLTTIRSRVQNVSFVPLMHEPKGVSGTTVLESFVASRPRLREVITDEMMQDYDKAASLVGDYIEPNITARFLAAKRVADAELTPIFIEILEDVLVARSVVQPYTEELAGVVRLQDRIHRNINARLCLEAFALEMGTVQ